MKKLFTLLLAYTACLVLTACADVRLDCGVDGSSNAYLNASIQVDLTDFSAEDAQEIRRGMQLLAVYYRDTLGYTVRDNITEEETALTLDMSLSHRAESPAAAFEALKRMLTDPRLTPFTAVNMTWAEEEFHRAYAAELTLNAEKLVSNFYAEGFPRDLQALLHKKLEESTATLRLRLPAAEAVSYSGALEQGESFTAVTSAISFESETTVSLIAKASTSHTPEGAQRQQQQLRQAIRIGSALCLIFLLLFLLQLLLRRNRQRL